MLESNAHKELIAFVQKNPVCYAIMRSPVHMAVLKALSKGAKGRIQLLRLFPRIDGSDIDLIIESLVDSGLVSSIDVGLNKMYYVNEKGKQFFAIFNKTKERMIGVKKRF